MRALLLSLLITIACSSSSARHRTATEPLPPPDPEEPQHVLVPEKGAKTLVVGGGPALCSVDDEHLVEVWSSDDSVSLVGKKRGRTIMHVARRGKPKVDVVVDVVAPQPDAVALTIGQSMRFAAGAYKSWSDSGPGIVEVSATADVLSVTGRTPGTNVVALVRNDGTSRAIEFTVVGGDRQIPAPDAPNPNAIVMHVGEWRTIPASREVRIYDFRPDDVIEVRVSPDLIAFNILARRPGVATLVFIRDDGSESFDFLVLPAQ
jgi:hypothetical protein